MNQQIIIPKTKVLVLTTNPMLSDRITEISTLDQAYETFMSRRSVCFKFFENYVLSGFYMVLRDKSVLFCKLNENETVIAALEEATKLVKFDEAVMLVDKNLFIYDDAAMNLAAQHCFKYVLCYDVHVEQ